MRRILLPCAHELPGTRFSIFVRVKGRKATHALGLVREFLEILRKGQLPVLIRVFALEDDISIDSGSFPGGVSLCFRLSSFVLWHACRRGADPCFTCGQRLLPGDRLGCQRLHDVSVLARDIVLRAALNP